MDFRISCLLISPALIVSVAAQGGCDTRAMARNTRSTLAQQGTPVDYISLAKEHQTEASSTKTRRHSVIPTRSRGPERPCMAFLLSRETSRAKWRIGQKSMGSKVKFGAFDFPIRACAIKLLVLTGSSLPAVSGESHLGSPSMNNPR